MNAGKRGAGIDPMSGRAMQRLLCHKGPQSPLATPGRLLAWAARMYALFFEKYCAVKKSNVQLVCPLEKIARHPKRRLYPRFYPLALICTGHSRLSAVFSPCTSCTSPRARCHDHGIKNRWHTEVGP